VSGVAAATGRLVMVWWGGPGLRRDHEEDCYLREGVPHRFDLLDGSTVDAVLRSFDGSALSVEEVGSGRQITIPNTSLRTVRMYPGYDAWGIKTGG
jgi:hypothetical protein